MLVPLQAGSVLMSILAALGATPSSFTVPLTLAAVAGSIGAAAGAEATGVAAGCPSLFLPDPASRTNDKDAGMQQTDIQVFAFIWFVHLPLVLQAPANPNSLGDPA